MISTKFSSPLVSRPPFAVTVGGRDKGVAVHKVFNCTKDVFFPPLLALLPTNNVAKLRPTNLQMRVVFGASGLIWGFNEGLSALMDARGTELQALRALKHATY